MDFFYYLLGVEALLLVGAAWFIVFIRKPLAIAFLLILLLPLENIYLEWGFIKLRFGELVGVMTFFLILVQQYSPNRRITLPPGFRVFLLFLFATSIPIFFSNSTDILRAGLVLQTHIFGLFLIAVTLYWSICRSSDPEKAVRLLFHIGDLYLLFGVFQFSLYYLFGVSLGVDSRNSLFSGLGFVLQFGPIKPSVFEMGDAPWFRPSSILREPVILGALAVWLFAVSVSKLLALNRIGKAWVIWLFRCALSGALVFLSGSRAAWGAAVVAAFVPSFIQRSSSFRIKTIAVAAVLGVGLFIVSSMGIPIVDRYIHGVRSRMDRLFILTDMRQTIYEVQLKGFVESPLFGVGPGSTGKTIRSALPSWWEPETVPTGGYSTIFTLLHDSGIVGLCLFLAFVGTIFICTRNALIYCDAVAKPWIAGFFNGLIAVIIWGLFSPLVLGLGIFWMAVAFAWVFSTGQNHGVLSSAGATQEDQGLNGQNRLPHRG